MGLQLSKTLSSGHTADYWRITLLRLLKNGVTECQVELYKDQAAAADNKAAVDGLSYTWEDADNPCTISAMDVVASNPFHLCYEKLKTLPEFSGATDV